MPLRQEDLEDSQSKPYHMNEVLVEKRKDGQLLTRKKFKKLKI